MKMRFLAAPAWLCATAILGHAQCSSTIDYTPKNPVEGDYINANLHFQIDPASPTPPESYADLLLFSSYTDGFGTQTGSSHEIITATKDTSTVSFSFQARQAGSFTLTGGGRPFEHYGVYNPCNTGGYGFESTITGQILPRYPNGRDVGLLNGQFQFVFNGALVDGNPGNAVGALGSFTFDGTGRVTAGVEDINSAAGSYANLSVSGSYTLEGGRGTLLLHTKLGAQMYALSVYNTDDGSGPTLRRVDVVPTDHSAIGTGTLSALHPSSGTSFLESYDVDLRGTPPSTIGYPYLLQPVFAAGQLTFTGGEQSGTVSANLKISSIQTGYLPDVAERGVAAKLDSSTGRFTFTLVPATALFQPTNFVGYLDGNQGISVLSLDSAKSEFILTGSGIR